jgi:hypothetical protein
VLLINPQSCQAEALIVVASVRFHYTREIQVRHALMVLQQRCPQLLWYCGE